MGILLNCILDRPAKLLCSRKADLTSVSNWGGYCEASENQQDSVSEEQPEQLSVGLENPNSFIIRLVRQMLEMAVDEDIELTPLAKMTLDDVMHYGSIAKVAKLQKIPETTVTSRLNIAFHRLVRLMNVWQDAHTKISQLTQQISELKAETQSLRHETETKSSEIERLRAANEQLHLQLAAAPASQAQTQSSFRKLTPQLKRQLDRKLEEVAFPIDIIRRLNAHSILTVSDLIQQSETDLSQFDGLTLDHIHKIRQHLSYMRLQLDTDILYVDALGDYYLKETINLMQ